MQYMWTRAAGCAKRGALNSVVKIYASESIIWTLKYHQRDVCASVTSDFHTKPQQYFAAPTSGTTGTGSQAQWIPVRF